MMEGKKRKCYSTPYQGKRRRKERETDIQTDRQVDIQTDRQVDRNIDRLNRVRETEMDKERRAKFMYTQEQKDDKKDLKHHF